MRTAMRRMPDIVAAELKRQNMPNRTKIVEAKITVKILEGGR